MASHGGPHPATVRAYEDKVGTLLKWLADNEPDALTSPQLVSPHHISAWLLALQETCGPYTINTRFKAVHAFFAWLEDWEVHPGGQITLSALEEGAQDPQEAQAYPHHG